MVPSNALQLLSIYNNEEEDSDEEVPFGRVTTKRPCRDDCNNRRSKILKSNRLPLPQLIAIPSANLDDGPTDDPNEHDGRIRNFPHERGNWATYLYIPYECDDNLHTFIEDLITKTDLNMKPIDQLHVSLTKTVVLRYHWINNFMQTVRSKLSIINCFSVMFNSLKIYCNEQRTRTFLGINIEFGCNTLMQIVNILDDCLREYNLPTFYEDPSFHISIAWCAGDHEMYLKSISDELNAELEKYVRQNRDNNWNHYNITSKAYGKSNHQRGTLCARIVCKTIRFVNRVVHRKMRSPC